MFTYSHANTPLGQSERVYYLGDFIISIIGLSINYVWSKMAGTNTKCSAKRGVRYDRVDCMLIIQNVRHLGCAVSVKYYMGEK